MSILLEESPENLRRIILLHFGALVSLWEKSQTPHVHDFGISRRVHDSQNQLYLSLETPGYLKQYKKNPKSFQTYYLGESQNVGIPPRVFLGAFIGGSLSKSWILLNDLLSKSWKINILKP